MDKIKVCSSCGNTGFIQWQIGEVFPCNCESSQSGIERARVALLCYEKYPSDQTRRCEWPKNHNGLHRCAIEWGYNKGKYDVWGIVE